MTTKTVPGMTHREIANWFTANGDKITRKTVARIEARALRKIHNALKNDNYIIDHLERMSQ